jgi:hypothetical protein
MNLSKMKKLIVILFVLFSVFGYSQGRYYTLEASDYLILDSDTMSTTTQVDLNDTIMATKQYVLNTAGTGNGWDSLLWTSSNGYIVWYYDGSPIDSINIDNRYLKIADSTDYATSYDLEYYVDSLSTLFQGSVQYVYEVNLPSSTTVSGRCTLASEGTDYPTGWTVEQGTYAVDLKVTHNLDRKVANVTVFAITEDQERQLFGNAAYSGIYTESDSILVVESLATIQKDIVIYIIFK